MFWLGKLLGAVFGFLVAGPFGAILGLLLGHFFDVSRKGIWLFNPPPRAHSQAQDVFFRTTFLIMGYLAKADGRVSENEIRAATRIMQNMMLTPELRQQAIEYFQQGKIASFNLDQLLSELDQACFHQPNLLALFLEIQVQAAYADGVLTLKKQRILEHICYRLGINSAHFFHQQSYGYNQQYQRRTHTQTPQVDKLEKSYRLLGVTSSTGSADIKKAYRKLMSQNHPDKLVSKGLPEEMLKLATQKTQEIKEAYETICKAKGI